MFGPHFLVQKLGVEPRRLDDEPGRFRTIEEAVEAARASGAIGDVPDNSYFMVFNTEDGSQVIITKVFSDPL